MLTRPVELNLSNWRQPGNTRWAFHHVREIIPTEEIACGNNASELDKTVAAGVAGVTVPGLESEQWSLQRWLDESSSDALLVAHRGKLVHEWYVDAGIETSPHIVFSVSKSITAMLAIGIHSQWIYINPVTEVTIVKMSSQNEPLRLELDHIKLQAVTKISAVLA